MKKLLFLICIVGITIGFSECKKDSNSYPGSGVKVGDIVQYKLSATSTDTVYFTISAYVAGGAQVSLTNYKFSTAAIIESFTATANNQSLGFTINSDDPVPRVNLTVLVNGVVVMSDFLEGGKNGVVLEKL